MEGKITIELIRALQRISRGTERKLLETITSRFFEQLADAASTAMDWAIETSGIARRHGNGISIANWAMEKMHQGCVAGFINDCQTKGEPLCNEDVDDVNLTVAMLMEAERHPARWRDLTAAEHNFINKCGGIIAEWQRTTRNGGTANRQPRLHEGDRLLRILNFVIWWCRNEGKPPSWLSYPL